MFTHVTYLMVNVSDMGRSVAFYRDVVGLPLKYETPGWTEFATGTTTVALHLSPCAEAKAGPSTGPTAGSCSIGFSVDDIDAAWKKLEGRGAHFVVPPMLRAEEGIRLAVFVDPDGLMVSIAEAVAKAEPGISSPR